MLLAELKQHFLNQAFNGQLETFSETNLWPESEEQALKKWCHKTKVTLSQVPLCGKEPPLRDEFHKGLSPTH